MRVRIRGAGLVFAATTIAELIVFVLVAREIGFGWALLTVLATSALGAVLLQREGVRAWQRYRSVTSAGGRPGPHLTRALIGLFGAVLLIIPGFITDVIGLALFIPPVRALAAKATETAAAKRLSSSVAGDLFGPRQVRIRTGKPVRDDDPLDGEVIDPR